MLIDGDLGSQPRTCRVTGQFSHALRRHALDAEAREHRGTVLTTKVDAQGITRSRRRLDLANRRFRFIESEAPTGDIEFALCHTERYRRKDGPCMALHDRSSIRQVKRGRSRTRAQVEHDAASTGRIEPVS